jgi:hypothetical protein
MEREERGGGVKFCLRIKISRDLSGTFKRVSAAENNSELCAQCSPAIPTHWPTHVLTRGRDGLHKQWLGLFFKASAPFFLICTLNRSTCNYPKPTRARIGGADLGITQAVFSEAHPQATAANYLRRVAALE